MPIAYIKTQIKQFIHNFEESVDRLMTMEEFIQKLPELYVFLKSDDQCKLQNLTEEQFMQLAQEGLVKAQMFKQFNFKGF